MHSINLVAEISTLLQAAVLKPSIHSTRNQYGKSADVDEQAKKEIKDLLIAYDRTLLVADPRRCEPKKYAPSLKI